MHLVSGRLRVVLTLILVTVNVIYAFPIVTGQVIQDPSWHQVTWDSLHVEIPPAWYKVGDWFRQNDPTAKVMLLPSFGYGSCYRWVMGTCFGESVARMFLPNQTIKYDTGVAAPNYIISVPMHKIVEQGLSNRISTSLSLLGIRYILQQNDLYWQRRPRETLSPPEIAAVLSQDGDLKKETSFGRLDVYSVANKTVYPLVYATNKLDFISGDVGGFDKLIRFKNPAFPESYYFTGDEPGASRDLLTKKSESGDSITVFSTDVNLSPNRAEYKVALPQEGTYRLYISRRRYEGLSEITPSYIQLSIDDGAAKPADLRGEGTVEDWIDLGALTLAAGDHTLTLTVPETELARQETYFNDKISAVNGKNGVYAITLPAGHYMISFPYRLTPNVRAQFFIDEKRCDDPSLVEGQDDSTAGCEMRSVLREGLSPTVEPLQYKKDFMLYAPAKEVNFGFEAKTQGFSGGSLNVGQVKIAKIIENQFVLVKGAPQPGSVRKVNPPQVSFSRRDPTLYHAAVSGAGSPYFLAFLNTFNRNWKLSIGGRTVAEDRHFMINGFANGWLVNPADAGGKADYQIVLEYTPQKYFRWSLGLSLLAIGAALAYLVKKKIYG